MIKKNLTNGEYSEMVANPLFWETLLKCFNCEHVLMFQTDTLLLKGGDAVDSFLKYDYVGAPWADDDTQMVARLPSSYNHINNNNTNLRLDVGNGGLSLRNVRVMLAITRNHPYPTESNVPEDVYFSYWLKVHQAVYWVPSRQEASAFAMEHVYNADAAGLHAPSHDVSEMIMAATITTTITATANI